MDFSDKDRIEALNIAGTGCWRLEFEAGKSTRFYGDSYLNYLIGVDDDTDPEERMRIFMSRVHEDDVEDFMKYEATLRTCERAEIVYRYNHPELGCIYVRCGGARDTKVTDCVCYRGYHQNVNDTVRIEQETNERYTNLAELYRTVAFKLMEQASNSAILINVKEESFEWYNFDGAPAPEASHYYDMIKELSSTVPEEYRTEYLAQTRLENLTEQLSQKGSYSFSSFINRVTDGKLRRVSYKYYSMKNNSNQIISIIQDTTEDYEKEIQLAIALKNAEAANRAKTIFLNNMSHDIRTPMNAIIGFTELVENNIDYKEKSLDYLNKIRISSKHLLTLINDVLDMSRIESGRMQLVMKPVRITEIMNGLKTIMQTDAEAKQLEFSVERRGIKDDVVLCDKLRLNQILLNCSSNAIKFTPAGGRITVIVTQIETDEGSKCGKYQFEIRDTGMGMSPDFVQKVFEPFSREDQTVHQIQGTGLGMAICKSIVDLFGGTIAVESEQGRGTTFTIVLSLEKAQEAYENPEHYDEPVGNDFLRGKRILLAEDNEINREIAIELLKETGADIDSAENGKKALEMFEESQNGFYDIILMDIQMPFLNGYAAAGAIRKLDRPDAKEVVIIAMTANAFEEDRQKAISCGMNDHLAKPIDVRKMMNKLRQYTK